ncbi:hypothetical protein QQX98_000942 [Neonectria punicea]|uniref:Uncharacterized protein n=1 Tax=Neonectria punicea TaxID=979145 RepID=A0ABR1HRI8_9HYPO
MAITEPSVDSGDRRDIYHKALDTGQHLVTQLHAITAPPPVHPPIGTNYRIVYGEFRAIPERILGPSAYTVMRVEQFDTNRLSWCEVYSRRYAPQDYVTLTKSDAHSGLLVVNELDRKHDTSIIGTESRISELLWHSYMEDATRQGRPPSSMRRIWADTVINEDTKIVA